tara:strand:+ start:444 stop:548 length:105 start_codon:yes stop_codon:yes gene_type:complete
MVLTEVEAHRPLIEFFPYYFSIEIIQRVIPPGKK